VRHLVIGLDAMEWTLVERWAAAGILPTFRQLLETGLRARLASVADCLPDVAWTSVAGGVNPGKLEKYFYVQYDADTGRLRYAPDDELRGRPFWMWLADAGRRVGVADVPHLPFHEIPGGFHVMGWGAHDTKGGPRTSPAGLRAEIHARFGSHPVGDCERHVGGPHRQRRLRAGILAGVEAHGSLFRWLMASRPWDVFICAFSASHCAGHHFWGAMDGTAGDAFADTVQATYRAIDREVGEMLALAGPDTRALLFAPHGMGPLRHASWNLNEILDRLGHGRPRPAGTPAAEARPARRNPWRLVKMTVPSRLQYAVKERLPERWQNQLLFLWYAGGRDCAGRRAFAVPNNEVVGAIRIGVRGRDRGGIVEPGAEHRQLRDEIAAALRELVDPVTGRAVVRQVTALHDVFHGPHAAQLPDLAVQWEAGFAWRAVCSPRLGTLGIRRQDRRTGSHTANSFLLVHGPGVPAGAELCGGAGLDIGPTVLRLCGVSVPEHLDGTPLAVAPGAPGRQDPR
jgi:predicted AlkP superfamily phosphohydrolase/phosphomutase